MIRLGLVGTGRWSDRYVEAAHNVGVVIDGRAPGRDAGACQELTQRCIDGELDGLIIATEPDHQAVMGISCLLFNIPALVEKPLGFTRGVANFALESRWSSPAPFFVDYLHLWAREFVQLRQRVDEARARGSVIESIESIGCGPGPLRSWSSLYDYGSHDIAMILSVLGLGAEITWVEGTTQQQNGGQLHRLLGKSGDTRISVLCGNGAEKKARRLTVRFGGGGGEVVYDDALGHAQPPLDCVVADFAGAIRRWRRTGMGDRSTLALSARVNGALAQAQLLLGGA